MVQQLPPDAPSPRLCVLQKTTPDQEYGYNLHAEKGRGQFVGMVDKGSVADIGGLRTGDRIFAINGHSIVGEPHKKVVERIKEQSTRCEMLVVSEADAKWYADHNIPINLQLPNIVRVPGDGVSHRGSNANNSPPPATWYAPSSKPADPVFIAPPPPHDEMDHPLPIICVLEKTTPAEEFGFNLHAEKNRGHFIGTVDAGGIGDGAGLRTGQRIVGVNGTLVYPNTPHKEVVSLIKKSPLSTTLLLASEEVDQWHKAHNEEFSFEKAQNAHPPEQQLSPHSIQISDEEEIVEAHPSPAPRHEVEEAPPLPTQPAFYEEPPMVQYDLVPADEEDIMASVFGGAPPAETAIIVGTTFVAPEEHEQEHLVEHEGHHGQPLVAEEPVEEEHVPYTAYAPVQETHHHSHHENNHHHHHEDYHHHQEEEHYSDHNHNGHLHHDPYHNGKTNGYSSQTSESSDVDIFRLSAKEARERLRQQKKRALDMSLEEKHRVVSSM